MTTHGASLEDAVLLVNGNSFQLMTGLLEPDCNKSEDCQKEYGD